MSDDRDVWGSEQLLSGRRRVGRHGEIKRAQALLSERLKGMPTSGFIGTLMGSLHAVLAGRFAEAVKLMNAIRPLHEPEGLVYLARHYSQMGTADEAISLFEQAAAEGFVSSPVMLTRDPTLVAVRDHETFSAFLKSAQIRTREARAEWKASSSSAARAAAS